MKPRPTSFIPPVIWAVFIYVLLTLPGSDIPKLGFLEDIYFDKWVHAGLFAMLVFLISWPFRKMYPPKHSLYIGLIFLALLYGIALEYVQEYFADERSYDVTDMIADGAGCFLGYIIFRYVVAKVKAKNKPL